MSLTTNDYFTVLSIIIAGVSALVSWRSLKNSQESLRLSKESMSEGKPNIEISITDGRLNVNNISSFDKVKDKNNLDLHLSTTFFNHGLEKTSLMAINFKIRTSEEQYTNGKQYGVNHKGKVIEGRESISLSCHQGFECSFEQVQYMQENGISGLMECKFVKTGLLKIPFELKLTYGNLIKFHAGGSPIADPRKMKW